SVPMGMSGYGENVWFAEFQGNKIGRVSAAGVISEFSIPTANSGPISVSVGRNGRVWFTETSANKIGILSQTVIAEFAVPSPNSGLTRIVADPNTDTAWFTERSANKIASLSTNGTFSEYVLPKMGSEPFGIVQGYLADLLFTERSGGAIGQFQPDALVL